MESLADGLPPEIAHQIHPDWRKNEAAYWAVRDQLLGQFQGQWIGFADGVVIVSGTSPVEVLHAAQRSGRHPFVICVGSEEEPSRIRRSTFPYDTGYAGEAIPLLCVEFRQASGLPGVALDRVIPDTGADASVSPWPDCQRLQLNPTLGVPSLILGVPSLILGVPSLILGVPSLILGVPGLILGVPSLMAGVAGVSAAALSSPVGEIVVNP